MLLIADFFFFLVAVTAALIVSFIPSLYRTY
jgi:hypothetical protein